MKKYTLLSLMLASLFLVAACTTSVEVSVPSAPEPVVEEPVAEPVTEPEETAQEAAPAAEEEPAETGVKEFNMIAKKWEFQPKTITVSKGDTVKLNIESIDVSHGFAINAFGVSQRLEPGTTTTIEFVADRQGTFSFFCSVFCGSGHGTMRGTLIVE